MPETFWLVLPSFSNEGDKEANGRSRLPRSFASCGTPDGPTSTAPANLSVQAQGVRLASSKVEAGKATEAQLQQGLQSAGEALSAVYAEACKAHPQLKGHLRGTFHIEAGGTPRMFMEIAPPKNKRTLNQLKLGFSARHRS